MKRTIALICLSLFLSPAVVLAANVSDCDPGTIKCYCPPAVTITDFPQNLLDVDDADASCESGCETFTENQLDVTGWAVQCEVGGVSTAINAGALGDDQPVVTGFIPVEESEFIPDVPQLGVKIPGLEFTPATREGEIIAVNYIGEYIEAIYAWMIGAGAMIAVILIMIGGLEWMLAAGSAERVGKAKRRIANAATGMALLLSAYTIAYLIDPGTITFETLEIAQVKGIDFIPNETPANFPVVGQGVISSEAAAGGVGWNDFIIFDQTQYGQTPYGFDPPGCFVPASNGDWGTGNIMSSGCGVASFAGVISSIGSQGHTTPDIVGDVFYREGHRPIGSNGCGGHGTMASAFYESSLLADNDLYGEYILIGGVGVAPAESRLEILTNLGSDPINPVIVGYRTESGGGHYVVLVGVEGENFLFNNPWGGTKQTRNIDEFFTVIKSASVIKRLE